MSKNSEAIRKKLIDNLKISNPELYTICNNSIQAVKNNNDKLNFSYSVNKTTSNGK